MLPHSELDNYKLQIELLQEKLQRSEDNRKKLEHKLDNAMQRKLEHEKLARSKQRQKYQEFVNELEKRNERNRQLMQMLDRIDQQTAAMSARSERLKMMKMQYEMYFAKLVQSQTMRCIQGPHAATNTSVFQPIPVLVPTPVAGVAGASTVQPAIMTPTSIKSNEHDVATPAISNTVLQQQSATKTAATATPIYQYDPCGNLIAGRAPTGNAPMPITYALSPRHSHADEASGNGPVIAHSPATQHWTWAMATPVPVPTPTPTPTPTCMMLTTTPTAHISARSSSSGISGNVMTATGIGNVLEDGVVGDGVGGVVADGTLGFAGECGSNFVTSMPIFEYTQYPIGYLPSTRHFLQPKPKTPNTTIDCVESDDLMLQPAREQENTKSARYKRNNKDNDENGNTYTITDGISLGIGKEIGNLSRSDLRTARQLDNDENSKVGILSQLSVEGAIAESLRTDIENAKGQQKQQLGEQQKQHHPQQQQQEQQQLKLQREQRQRAEQQLLSGVSAASSASMLTLDKLPTTMTMTERDTALASTPIDDGYNDVADGRRFTSTAHTANNINSNNKNNNNSEKPQLAVRFDEFFKGINTNASNDKDALPVERIDGANSVPKITEAAEATLEGMDGSPSATATATAATAATISAADSAFPVINNDNGNSIETQPRQKIDKTLPWQQQQLTQSWLKEEPTTSGDKDNTLRCDKEMTGGLTEYAENKDNAFQDTTSTATTENNNNVKPPKVSIEKIENEIYGELVNPSVYDDAENIEERTAAQGLVNNLISQKTVDNQEDTTNFYSNFTPENIPTNNNAVVDFDQSTSESYDPTYATIESTTNVEVYDVTTSEAAYSDDPNAPTEAIDYGQYNADPSNQQDYANVDYANYDPNQYASTEGYDPNAYPGYTYDETTGEYKAIEGQNYVDETAAAYDPSSYQQQEQQQQQEEYDNSQQQPQDYDYSNYTQETEVNDPNASALGEKQQQQQESKEETIAATPSPVAAAVADPNIALVSNIKPTSILSSADKQAAANDAQKKKKRVNFVDSSETDDSSSVKQAAPPKVAPKSGSGGAAATGSESDFDFSST